MTTIMNTETSVFKILLLKAYLDKGMGLLYYFKYVLAIAGIGAVTQGVNYSWVFIVGVAYGLFCLLLGWAWYKYHFIDIENEINNIFNPFQREVREKLNNRKVYKV